MTELLTESALLKDPEAPAVLSPYSEREFSRLSLTPLIRSGDGPYRLAAAGSLCAAAFALWTLIERAMAGAVLPDPSALGLIALALAVFSENRQPHSSRAKTALALVGPFVCLGALAAAVTGFFSIPIVQLALFALGASASLSLLAVRRHTGLGDILGTVLLSVLAADAFFVITGSALLPSWKYAATAACLCLAVIGRLGPLYFPIRPFMGPFVHAVLMRTFLPSTLCAVLLYLALEKTVLSSMDPVRAVSLTLLLAMLTMSFLVLRASAVLSPQLEKALKETDQLYSELVRNLKDHGMVLLNEKGQIVLWNPGAEHLTGYKASESVGEKLSQLLFEPVESLNHALEMAATQGAFFVQKWVTRKDGRPFWAETMISSITDNKGQALGFSVVIRDFTERKRSDEKLQVSLRDKETMLKEIHHRVKNNLQVISSLLRLQSEKAQDEKTLSLFRDSQARVHAMAMVHEYLYQSPDLARIDFPAYVQNLVHSLCRSYGAPMSESLIQIQVDRMLLSLDMAVPCGLLLTELVSNALKYAYPDKNQGPIAVQIRALPDGTYALTVSDQGVGLPPRLDWKNTSSLGLQLVRILTDQIHGRIWLEQDAGTRFVVTFRDPKEDSLKNGGPIHA